MERRSIRLINAQQGHAALMTAWLKVKAELIAGREVVAEFRGATRTNRQNALMWSVLGDLARQVIWYGQRLDAEAWKDVLTAGLKRQRVVPGIDMDGSGGGFVVLGQRTSRMSRSEVGDVIDLGHAFGDQHGVKWSPTSLGREWDL